MDFGLQNELLSGSDSVDSLSGRAAFDEFVLDAAGGNAIFSVDEKLSLVYATDKFYKLLGFSKEEYEKRALLYLRKIHEETGTYVLKKASRAAQSSNKEIIHTIEASNIFEQKLKLRVGVRFIERVGDKSFYLASVNRVDKGGFNYDLEIDRYLKNSSNRDNHAVMVIRVGNLDRCRQKYGDKFADTLIVEIHHEIYKSFRQSDVVVQISPNEFLVFMKKTGEVVASRKAEDLSLIISDVYCGETQDTALYSNIGISYYPYDGVDFNSLFVNADSACYYAIEEGHNHICAYEERMKSYYRKRDDDFVSKEPTNVAFLDNEIISFAFRLLADTQDLKSTIHLLLEQIGHYYDLSSISVIEQNEYTEEYECINSWKRGMSAMHDHGEDLCHYVHGDEDFLTNQFFCEEGDGDFSDDLRELFRKNHMKSFLCSNFNGEWFGNSHVIFNDGKRKRSFSDKEKVTMHELARLISAYSLNYKKQERAMLEIENLRNRDSLTGLYNRDSFLKEAVRIYDLEDDNSTYGVCYSDFNGFEYINSAYGQEFGDSILKEFARAIENERNIILTCRVYSDCFLTLWKGKNPRAILDQVNDLYHLFLNRVKKDHPLTNLSIANGIAYLTRQDFEQRTDIMQIVENANMARKEAKTKNGGHTIIYNSVLRERLEEEQKVAAKLEEAIYRGNIELFLQPKFSLEDRKVIGAEALVRWRAEDGTYRMPMEFIPALERIGLIKELDFYIYEQVLKYMKKWKMEGKRLFPISVNFSRLHTQSEDFVRQVIRQADYYDVDRSLLEIEITESTLSEDANRMLNDMDLLQKAGFKVDIDDFGTGYSSLNMLLRAPVDVVKLDKSFLFDVADSERQRDYLNCIAKLIAAADKEIVFEGVETEYQAKLISDFGYDKVQGFLFGKPIPARDFEITYMLSNIELLSESYVG